MIECSIPNDEAATAPSGWQHLKVAAQAALIIHLAAGVSMALVLRLGLETAVNLGQRLEFLVNNQPLWLLAWIPWNLAAFSILYFFYRLDKAHTGDIRVNSRLLHLSISLCIAAVVADLSAEAIEMKLIPDQARGILQAQGTLMSPTVADFLQTHRVATLLTGYLGNGLYTLSTALSVWCTRRGYGLLSTLAGACAVTGGTWLSVAALVDSASQMVLSNVLLMPSLLVWLATIARGAAKRATLPRS